MSHRRVCPFCGKEFQPSKYHPRQIVCSEEGCQQKRRSAFHRKKVAQDPAYAKQCRESRKKWRINNRPRVAEYRKLRRLDLARATNEQITKQRKELINLIGSSGVFNLRRYTVEVWCVCDDNPKHVEKILAAANLIILHIGPSSSPAKLKG
jgi:hypothetical protein